MTPSGKRHETSGAIGSQATKHFLMPGVNGGLFSRNHKKVFNQKWAFSYRKFVPFPVSTAVNQHLHAWLL